MLIEVTAPEGWQIVEYGELKPGEFYLSNDGKVYQYHNILGQSTPFYGIKVVKLRRLSELKRGDKFKFGKGVFYSNSKYTMITTAMFSVGSASSRDLKYFYVSEQHELCGTNQDYPVTLVS